MSFSDIPRWIRKHGVPEANRRYQTGKRAVRPQVCLSWAGNDVVGKRPAESYTSNFITKEEGVLVNVIAVSSTIYQFPSRGEAQAAWSTLVNRSAGCATHVTVEAEGGKGSVSMHTTVARGATLFGIPSLTVRSDAEAVARGGGVYFELVSDSYTVYRLAGTSIVEARYGKLNSD